MSELQSEGISPLGPLTVVSIEDDAVDIEAMGRDGTFRYLLSRDEKLLVMKPGMTPIRYTLRPLARKTLVRFVNAVDDMDARYIRALMATLECVRDNPNLPGIHTPESKDDRALGTLSTEDAVIECVEPAGAIYELGKLAYDRAHISPKGRRVCFPPPGSLNRNSERLRVAAMKTREAEQAPTPPRPVETSEPTGNATAPESDSTSPAAP